jgi:asparagine synthase (glutamine-hydrolysing)
MCGIAGYRGPHVPGRLAQMIGKLVHRGPDGEGTFDEDDVHLGMRRLAIVDVEGGGQPKRDASGDVVVLFNGEIYNYVELREELIAGGTKVESHSDTEVIAHLYAKGGMKFVERLVGMFAISLYDRRSGDLFLIRDRLGKKPILYTRDGGTFAYASEIQALPVTGRAEHLDRDALLWFFSQKTVPSSATIDTRVKKVPPGSWVRVPRSGEPELVRWWKIPASAPKKPVADEKALVEEIDVLVRESVRLRMRADVEVGAFLSGGLDSSLVVALASRLTDKPLKTYCLVYDQEINHKASDRKFARLVSDRFATRHREVLLTPELFAEALPQIARHYGQPNSAVLSNWFISREMGKELKVALSGDGADELFGSYFLHRTAAAIADSHRRGDDVPLERLPKSERDFAKANAERGWADLADAFAVFPSSEIAKLVTIPDAAAAITKALRAREADLESTDLLDLALEADCKNLLADQILNYSDVLSMAHSLEVRTPFLDHRLVERMFTVPPELKIHEGDTKHLLKQVARCYLPEELITRPKEGFVEPAVYWIGNELADLCKAYLLGESFDRRGLLDHAYVKDLVDRFYRDRDFTIAKRVWNLFMFAMWEAHGNA